MKKMIIVVGMLLLGLGAATTAYAATPEQAPEQTTTQNTQAAAVAQSDRWDGAGDTWRIKTEDGTGYLTNSWFQDTDSSWYMLGQDGTMLSGLVTDRSTGKTYLLNPNHDGTFGRMLTQDGPHTINGTPIYLTFNQSHDGSYGAITSGLSELRSIGLSESQLASIPTDSATSPQQFSGSTTQQTQEAGNDNSANKSTSSWIDSNRNNTYSIDHSANQGLELHN